ncbi:hypothetical protein GSI_11098 [Ganoderma sinense ZZ0214-1]|uniref:Uncharacterized protein n=1 Tax=Ganoderma sinense ZZ0214-1 TaxID=1077348 RepID=A0A2G8RZC2_9APHY|nr:hypothetical protein GSI_11098 [Ganoderma sinense ZZ0214-1]
MSDEVGDERINVSHHGLEALLFVGLAHAPQLPLLFPLRVHILDQIFEFGDLVAIRHLITNQVHLCVDGFDVIVGVRMISETVRGHLLLRQIIPRFRTEQSSDRAHFVQVVNQLFSVPGLYRFIIEQGAYPQGGQEHFSIYPGPTANVSVFDIAGWLARCGLTEESIELMVPMAIRHRRESDGRRPDSTIPFASWPARLDDVTAVPPFAALTWTDDVADDDASMDEDHASIHGATAATAGPSDPVPMDETPDPAPATAPVPSAALPPASASNTTTAPTPAPSVTVTAPAPSTAATALAQPSTPAASSVPGPSTKPDEAAPPRMNDDHLHTELWPSFTLTTSIRSSGPGAPCHNLGSGSEGGECKDSG